MKLKLTDKLLIVVLTVVINLGLFIMIPVLSETEKEPLQDYEPATVVSLEKPEMKETEEKEEKMEPEEEPRELPQKDIRQEQREMKQPEMQMDIPDFELNTDLEQGMQISVPSKGLQDLSGADGFEMGEVDNKPRVVRKVPPVYPHKARRNQISGKVVLRFLVTKQGEVKKVSVVKAKPKGYFEKQAKEAVRKWRFEPGTYKGEPVPTWVELPITFDM